jgi:hypothetical protein
MKIMQGLLRCNTMEFWERPIFWGIDLPYFLGLRYAKQWTKRRMQQVEICFLLGWHTLWPFKDGGNTFILNTGYSPNYTASQPRSFTLNFNSIFLTVYHRTNLNLNKISVKRFCLPPWVMGLFLSQLSYSHTYIIRNMHKSPHFITFTCNTFPPFTRNCYIAITSTDSHMQYGLLLEMYLHCTSFLAKNCVCIMC